MKLRMYAYMSPITILNGFGLVNIENFGKRQNFNFNNLISMLFMSATPFLMLPWAAPFLIPSAILLSALFPPMG